jgi:hypothetical protein
LQKYYLGASEIIDIAAGDGKVLCVAARRECGVCEPICLRQVRDQAISSAQYLESVAIRSLGGFQTLMQGLSTIAGPKTVALVSQRLVAGDRVGGRVDLFGRLTGVADQVAAADARLYVIHTDDSFFDGASAGSKASAGAGERAIARGLEQLAGKAGGSYIQIAAGTADRGFDRVLRETSAYYLLGVSTEPADRNGRTHFVRIAVRAEGADVHHRTQVVIPKEAGKK